MAEIDDESGEPISDEADEIIFDDGGGASVVPKIMLLQDHFSGGVH